MGSFKVAFVSDANSELGTAVHQISTAHCILIGTAAISPHTDKTASLEIVTQSSIGTLLECRVFFDQSRFRGRFLAEGKRVS